MVPTSRIPEVTGRALRVVALSDTHAPRRWKSCPPPVAAQLRLADVILHAGDVCTAAVLDELSGYAPVLGVVGNNDGPDVAAWGATPTLEADLGGLRVAMIHDSGQAHGRLVGQTAEHHMRHLPQLLVHRRVQRGVAIAVDGTPPRRHPIDQLASIGQP